MWRFFTLWSETRLKTAYRQLTDLLNLKGAGVEKSNGDVKMLTARSYKMLSCRSKTALQGTL